jgi:hypothetical protein
MGMVKKSANRPIDAVLCIIDVEQGYTDTAARIRSLEKEIAKARKLLTPQHREKLKIFPPPVLAGDRSLEELTCTARDITNRQRLERALVLITTVLGGRNLASVKSVVATIVVPSVRFAGDDLQEQNLALA